GAPSEVDRDAHGVAPERDPRSRPVLRRGGRGQEGRHPARQRMTQFLDVGAYCGTFTAFQACTCLMAGGAYQWKGISGRTIGILTNRAPPHPYRAAGRPEATHLLPRILDLAALALTVDPAESRRQH